MKIKINKNLILSFIFIVSLMGLGFWFKDFNFIKQPQEVQALTYTADLCTSGTASADSEYNTSYAASMAFDNLYSGNANYWQTANVAMPHWLKYDFGSGNEKTIARYTLRSFDATTRIYDINRWVFQGSNDNSTWVNLDVRAGITWTQSELKTFDILNVTAYRYYRVYIYANSGENNYGLIQEMEMMETTATKSDCGTSGGVSCTKFVDGTSNVEIFTGAGTTTWTVPTGVSSVDYLIVGGGGAGGYYLGGGGAGGFVERTGQTAGSSIQITVGAGGIASSSYSSSSNGSNSSVNINGVTVIAYGGGAGSYAQESGHAGGSGGGSSAGFAGGISNQPTTGDSAGYGYAGGIANGAAGGGGGGASEVGQDYTDSQNGGPGGDGRTSSITGSSIVYAGGGGGASGSGLPKSGGNGGGGTGARYDPSISAIAGVNNSGGGGGGGYTSYASNANGGSGVVIIKYTLAPVISEVYPIYGPTNDTTPNYTFNSTAAGTITYGGSCSSSTTTATAGNNTITLNTLTAGTYSNCTIQVSGSNVLTISKFIIGEDCGSNSEVECSQGLDNGYYINRYTYLSGTGTTTWSVPTGVSSVEYLVVAGGGGGGGYYYAGGGGAGGLLTASGYTVTPEASLPVIVGAGGAGGASSTVGSNGVNSVFNNITAIGGGGGGSYIGLSGSAGGSGGGSGIAGSGGSGTSGQGNSGGTANPQYSSHTSASGGGGAGGAGGNGSDTGSYLLLDGTGVGGPGLASSITGTSIYYAGGGGGGSWSGGGGTGGAGGGGNGGAYDVINPTSGTANTGGGGGGASYGAVSGGSGGSGVVIIKYVASQNHNYYCSYYYDDDNVLQVGKNGFLDFKFTYQDPNASATLSGYRIAIDTSELALENIDSQADVIVPDTSTWVSGGNVASGTQITNSQVSVQMIPNASLEQIGYGTGSAKKSYYWWVKVRNSNGLESAWVPGNQFYTPQRHYPIVRPVATTENITINANMQFCAGTDLTNQDDEEERDVCYSACWKGTPGSAVVGEAETNWKCSICYDSTNSPVSCTDPTLIAEGKTLFTWHGPAGYILNTDYTYESLTTSASANPVIKFTKTGESLKMGLNITGSDCGGETAEMVIGAPMPKWKEVSPF